MRRRAAALSVLPPPDSLPPGLFSVRLQHRTGDLSKMDDVVVVAARRWPRPESVLEFIRLAGGGESRLHGRVSIGVGGFGTDPGFRSEPPRVELVRSG